MSLACAIGWSAFSPPPKTTSAIAATRTPLSTSRSRSATNPPARPDAPVLLSISGATMRSPRPESHGFCPASSCASWKITIYLPKSCLLAPGGRTKSAQERRTHWYRANPHGNDREYLLDIFSELVRLPGMKGLLDPVYNPLWSLGPDLDGAQGRNQLLANLPIPIPAFSGMISPIPRVALVFSAISIRTSPSRRASAPSRFTDARFHRRFHSGSHADSCAGRIRTRWLPSD